MCRILTLQWGLSNTTHNYTLWFPGVERWICNFSLQNRYAFRLEWYKKRENLLLKENLAWCRTRISELRYEKMYVTQKRNLGIGSLEWNSSCQLSGRLFNFFLCNTILTYYLTSHWEFQKFLSLLRFLLHFSVRILQMSAKTLRSSRFSLDQQTQSFST